MRRGDVDVPWHQIDQVHAVPAASKPERIAPRATADVDDLGRGGWKIARDQLSSPGALEFTERTTQTSVLIELGVVVEDRVRRRHGVISTRHDEIEQR